MQIKSFGPTSPWWALAQEARAAAGRAYAPFSGLCVGAAWATTTGDVFRGANYESASYGLTQCAERAALTAAQQAGAIETGRALVLTALSAPGSGTAAPALIVPCGACRQWLFEVSVRLGRDFPVVCVQGDSAGAWTTSARALLPAGFGGDPA